ncbi:hypothetical protein CANCADRAFT_125704 [Tortispora caseinolytica NRRL Y-17796]|uniref:RRM domain-containing protein n=1 Tax=Tortispora caseinolytica NRRL Y-17796 TaxID=767744 RepID=A0A1E4TA22_9ASCO|nr:hypothetical protein CANCADRAFT_125704 [Tortispora caseinolytica NRRL Y-17796]
MTTTENSEPVTVTPTSTDAPAAAPADIDKRRLFIRNLPFKVNTADLQEFLSGYKLEKLSIAAKRISKERPGRRRLGFAFATLATSDEAARAKDELNGKELLGREVMIEMVVPTDPAVKSQKKAERKKARKEAKNQAKANAAADVDANSKADTGANSDTKAASTDSNGTSKVRKQKKINPDDAKPSKDTIYISNVDYTSTPDELTEFVKGLGIEPKEVNIPRRRLPFHFWKKNQLLGTPIKGRGFAFVKVSSEEELAKAVELLNGKTFKDRVLTAVVAMEGAADSSDSASHPVTEADEPAGKSDSAPPASEEPEQKDDKTDAATVTATAASTD